MKKMKFLSLIFFLTLSVSACGLNTGEQVIENTINNNEEKQSNQESQSTQEKINKTENEKSESQNDQEIVSGPVGDHGVDRSVKSSTREGWLVYQNEEYGFEFEYPDYFYVNDCSPFSSASVVYIEDFKSINTCNSKGGRINIFKSDKLLELPYLKESTVITKYGSYKRLSGDYEMFGPEGEKRLSEPMQFASFTFIPYEKGYLYISYEEVFEVKEAKGDDRHFEVQKDYRKEYEEIIQSFILDIE